MIQVNNLTKKFENGYIALDNVTFCLPNKGIVCITGESGSGKTTLLNCMYGKLSFEGSIEIDGLNGAQKEFLQMRKNIISMVYQDYRLLDNLTVEDNLRLSCEIAGDEFSEEYLNELMDKVNLKKRLVKSKCKTLSGGEKQRVAIARALAQKAKIIFADEPTGNLDSKNSKTIFDLFKDLSKDILIVIVTHNMKLMQEYSDFHICLKDGKIAETNLLDDGISLACKEKFGENAQDKSDCLRQNYVAAQNKLSNKAKLLIMRLPFKSKGVAICLTSIFAVFLCIAFVLGSTLYFDESVLFSLNAKTKNESVVTVKNTATRLPNDFLEKSKIKNACYSFENNKFINYAIPHSEDSFLNENYIKFIEEPDTNIFVECDKIAQIGGALLAGRDVNNFDEIIINESLAYYLRAVGEFDGKKIENYTDLLGRNLGGFAIVGILDAQYGRISEEYLELTRGDFLVLSKEEQEKAQTHKSMIESNNSVNMFVVKNGHSEHFRNTYVSLNNNTAKYRLSFRTYSEKVNLQYEYSNELNYYNVEGELVDTTLKENEVILPKQYFEALSLDDNFTENYSLGIEISSYEIPVVVKGYTDNQIIYVSSSFEEGRKNFEEKIYDAINFSSKSSPQKNIKHFVNKIEEDYSNLMTSQNNQLVIQTPFSAGIGSIGEFYSSFKAIFIISFILFSVIAALFGYTLARLLLSRIKNEISILISVGLDKATAKKIILSSLLILSGIAILAATVLYLLVIFLANYLLSVLATSLFNMMFFSFPVYAAVIVVAIIAVYCTCAYDKTINNLR